MDFFFFVGPTYQEVLRQYHNIIGKPKRLPIWSHGFVSKSSSYITRQNLEDALQAYKDNKFAIESIAMPQEAMRDQYNSWEFIFDLKKT